jgi:outer membrane protein insertion porin family
MVKTAQDDFRGRLVKFRVAYLMRKYFGLVGLLVLFFTVAAPVGLPLFVASTAQAARVTQIVIEGAQRVERETVLSYLQFAPGEDVDNQKIDASIKAMFQTGLFADVSIVRRGTAMVIRIVENPLINLVNFEGNGEIDDQTLQKEVEVKERMIFTKARVQSDTRRILTLYQSKGFYNVRVNPKLIRLPENRVNLAFEISENGKTEVSQINISGNRNFSADTLKGIMITKESAWWNPLLRNNTYDEDRLNYDKELLRRYYLKNGFADIQVVSADAHLTPDGQSFIIDVAIEEGPRYSVADVAVNVGQVNLDPNGLKRVVRTGVGDTYDASKVDKSVEKLTLEASDQGFVFARVEPKVDRDAPNQKVNITYNITEGPRAYIERIDIVGNNRTLDEVIRRELRIYEGDAFNRTLIERARRRLTALDYFEKIDFRESQGEAFDKVILTVDVTEKSTGSLTFSIGYSSTEAVVGSVELAERNLLGRGLQVRLNTSLSIVKQQLDFSYTDPYFLGSPISAGVDAFATKVDNTASSSYVSEQIGGALRTGFNLDEYSSVGLKYFLAYRRINGIDKPTSSPSVISQEGTSWKSAISGNYQYDDIDNPAKPTSGARLQLVGEVAGLGGDVRYGRAEVHGFYFIPFFEDQVVLKLEANAGHIVPFDSNGKVSVQDRFFKGADSFRGFSRAGIGPKQIGNDGLADSIGGNTYAIGTIEATFPLGLPEAFGIEGEVFSDFGTVFNSGENTINAGVGDCNFGAAANCTVSDTAAFRASIGAGIVWTSPFGPLKFELAYPLIKESYDQTENFRFSIGTRF